MNKQLLKAYLDLIQELLSCPRGEEWILLRQNEGLVNGELVEVMEHVANHLTTEGNIKAAKYLHNWAGKLHHILTENVPLPENNNDKTQAYIELIQTLLNCPEGAEESILEAHQDLIGPGLVKVMKQVANQIAAEGNESTANFLANLATDLNRTWLKNHEFKPTLKKEIALDPWFDEAAPSPDLSTTETQPTDLETPIIETTEESAISSSQPQMANEQQLIPQLKAISDSLVRLETTLASRLQPINPLWYMDVLEKAEAANWILTTDEVEHLIGTKPHCYHDETTYHRGIWVFIKAGKIGAQTGWQVTKQDS
ncbi:conserved hypothetical protein [Hyella patelloides LEGE 07179]|uniref:Uncharacterized protein n=1 Tax=Hyella patelloides LEGE 07179 TaxID=945734 RepID=A0A563W4V7_9CYAN|nr:hypothetical protein [Hyella patelloides]VEP18714.1 conserved hypothetical protein [Hyella patelloides LEGE 07179]